MDLKDKIEVIKSEIKQISMEQDRNEKEYSGLVLFAINGFMLILLIAALLSYTGLI